MNEPLLTVIGNLTADPELRYTQSGVAVASFTVAATPRVKQDNEWVDGEALFQRCSVWREYAENVANSLHKGDRVIAHGRLISKKFTDRDGNERSSLELEVEEVAPSLRYAQATVVRQQGNRHQQGNQQQAYAQGGPSNQRPPQQGQRPPQQQQRPQYAQPQQTAQDQWAQPGAYDDETPF